MKVFLFGTKTKQCNSVSVDTSEKTYEKHQSTLSYNTWHRLGTTSNTCHLSL